MRWMIQSPPKLGSEPHLLTQCENYSPGLSSVPPRALLNLSVSAATVLTQLIIFCLDGWGHLRNVLLSLKCKLSDVLCLCGFQWPAKWNSHISVCSSATSLSHLCLLLPPPLSLSHLPLLLGSHLLQGNTTPFLSLLSKMSLFYPEFTRPSPTFLSACKVLAQVMWNETIHLAHLSSLHL